MTTNRGIAQALTVLAGVLVLGSLLLLAAVGWPQAGSDGPSHAELVVSRIVVTAPLTVALVVLAVSAVVLASARGTSEG